MSKITQHRKPVLLITLSLLFTAIAVFMACRKTNQNESVAAAGLPAVFNAEAAKEWFYGTFKKSNEFLSVPIALDGKKLPDWDGGRYKKLGNTEMVEYPLVQQKKRVPVKTTTGGGIDARLAEAGITRAVLVKKNGKTALRLVQWVPNAAYAQAKNYDISQNSLLNAESDFTGKVLITRWDGLFIKGYQMENGRKTKAITKMQNRFKREEETATPNTPINPDCTYSYYAWAEQNCNIYTNGDDISIEVCSNWELVWDNLQETSCPISQSECETLGLSTEDCLCQTIGLCGDDGDGEDCTATQEQVEAIAATHEVDNTLIEHTSTPLPNNQWEEHYKWRIYKVSWPCTKAIFSNEKAILKTNGNTYPSLPANATIFHSFTHGNLSSSGATFGYALSYGESNNYVRMDPQDTYVKIWFDVTTEVGCAGSPFATTSEEFASRHFNP